MILDFGSFTRNELLADLVCPAETSMSLQDLKSLQEARGKISYACVFYACGFCCLTGAKKRERSNEPAEREVIKKGGANWNCFLELAKRDFLESEEFSFLLGAAGCVKPAKGCCVVPRQTSCIPFSFLGWRHGTLNQHARWDWN